MQLTYTNFDASELNGDTLADYLIALEADFEIRDGHRLIYSEPSFPVVELARSLNSWIADGGQVSFVFESMSSDDPGLVTIEHEHGHWRFFSAVTPETVSSVVDRADLEECVHVFVRHVASDLTVRGFDATRVLGRNAV